MQQTADAAIARQIIALVDDDASVLRGLKRLLEANSYASESFDSGEAFLAHDRIDHVACVVLDIHLGGMSGIETRRVMLMRGATVPVIFMTALDTDEVRRTALDIGCVAYLRKPFAGDELIGAIRTAISQH